MPRKVVKSSAAKAHQQTLLDHFTHSSSPLRNQSGQNPKREAPSAPKMQVRRQTRQARHCHDVEDVGDSDENSIESDVDQIHFEPQITEISDDEERPQSTQKPRRKAQHARVVGSQSDNSPSEGESSGSMEVEVVRHKTNIRRGRRVLDSGEDSTTSATAPKPKKRKLVKGRRPTPVEDDDDDLMDGVDEEKIVSSRLRQRAKPKSEYQRNLERLKRRKQGRSRSTSVEESDVDGVVETPPRPFRGARPDTEANGSNESQEGGSDEDDFIVHDENEPQGTALPAVFSMSSHQDMSHHFKIICQYMVHIVTTPLDQRQEVATDLTKNEYFSVPLHIARRKIDGIRDTVASSVWKPLFKNALKRYPTLSMTVLDFAVPHCDACNLGGRLSTLVGRLEGVPYESLTYEPLNPSDSDATDSDEPSKREFNLGRFCARRTNLFHRLLHWEHALYTELSAEIGSLDEDNGSRPFVRVAFAGGIKPPDDTTDADQMMDWLDQRGIIRAEWVKVRDLMAQATNLEVDAKKGDNLD